MDEKDLNANEIKEVKEYLSDFGLGENDMTVYFALLKGKKNTLTPLSKELKLPVTTVQSVLNRLAEKGIVMVSKNKSRSVYEAYDPSIMKALLQRKLEDINNVVPLLRKLKNTEDDHLNPKVRVYYKDQVRDVFHEALGSEKKRIFEIVSAENFQEVIGEKFHFTKRRVENGVHLRSLRVRAHEIKKYSKRTHVEELREAKFLPHELDFLGSLMIWDDSVAFFTSKKEGFAVVIESQLIRETIMQLFDFLWGLSGEMVTKLEK